MLKNKFTLEIETTCHFKDKNKCIEKKLSCKECVKKTIEKQTPKIKVVGIEGI